MGWFSRKHKKEKKQTKTSSQSEDKPYETGEQRYGHNTQSDQQGQYGSSQQRYDQQPQMSRQLPETGYRSGGDTQPGGGNQSGGVGGGFSNPPYRSGSTGYNPAPDYGPSCGYEVPSGGYPNNARRGRIEPQYEQTGYQKRDERVESGRRRDDDYTQGTPGRYPDTPRIGGYDESGGGSSGGYRPYEGEGGGYGY